MVTKIDKNLFWLFIIIITAFLVRIYHFSFPAFTSNEARIAYRGYTLATTGKDELGRVFPILFNSLEDYQLPAVSYLTASGEFIFGKSEFGVRIPFMLIGTILVFLTYQIAKFICKNSFFWFTSAIIVAFSPTLIFLSKVPNETIVLVFLMTLLFYLVINKKSLLLIVPTMVLAVLTSKQAWFILLPFTLFTLMFYQELLSKKRKLLWFGFSVVIVISAFTLFLTIPQAKRSLLENNFSLFSEVAIKNGIDRLRGQGMESGWPISLDRLLFNKAHFLTTGLLHWLSNISPAVYFGQFDNSGRISYSFLGAWAKILLIPFVLGLTVLIKGNDRKKQLLFVYILILTFPAAFVYPKLSLELVVLTLPFMALIISVGFEKLNRWITLLVFFLMVLELAINIHVLSAEYKNTTILRPTWIKQLTWDVTEKSKITKTAVSDDIVSDVVSYIEWYTFINPSEGFQPVPSPYKYRQYQLGDIKIIGSNESFTNCGKDEKLVSVVSKRDLEKINQFNIRVDSIYKDNNNEDRAYLTDGICIK